MPPATASPTGKAVASRVPDKSPVGTQLCRVADMPPAIDPPLTPAAERPTTGKDVGRTNSERSPVPATIADKGVRQEWW